MFWLLYIFPKNLISSLFGKLVHLRLPSFIVQPVIRAFARRYGANLNESAHSADYFKSLGDFFVRTLKPGARPIGEGIVSPADGKLVNFGLIENDSLTQIKGRNYSLSEFLCDAELARRFKNGFFVTIYLAPGDYHHVHSPQSGEVRQSIHIPGTLWPVNEWSVKNIDKLFCVNERVVTCIGNEESLAAVVMVGATNVGSMEMVYDSFVTNPLGSGFVNRTVQNKVYSSPLQLQKGDKLGTFNLGSTVVLLFEQEKFTPGSGCVSGKIKFGESIGS